MHSSSDDRRILRASDADRDAVIERLRHHGAVGRLSVDELTERIEATLEAKTLGQLDDLLRDLPSGPSLAAMPPPVAPPVPFRAWRSTEVLRNAARLVVLNLVCIGLWATGVGHGFWPAWILLVSLAVFSRKTSRAAARAEREARRAARRRTPPPFLDR